MPQNSMHQKDDMKQVPYRKSTIIMCHHKKHSHPDKLASAIGAPLSNSYTKMFSAHVTYPSTIKSTPNSTKMHCTYRVLELHVQLSYEHRATYQRQNP